MIAALFHMEPEKRLSADMFASDLTWVAIKTSPTVSFSIATTAGMINEQPCIYNKTPK